MAQQGTLTAERQYAHDRETLEVRIRAAEALAAIGPERLRTAALFRAGKWAKVSIHDEMQDSRFSHLAWIRAVEWPRICLNLPMSDSIRTGVMKLVCQIPDPDALPEKVVEALRLRALNALIYADVVSDRDKVAAAQAREAACRLRCQAAVIEALSVLYEDLGLQAQRWAEFAERLAKPT